MNFLQYSVLSVLLLNGTVYAARGVFPTNEEQVNLLTAVREVFEKFKSVVIEEEIATENSVSKDIQKIAKRADQTLDLLKERAFLQLFSNNNKVCSVDARGLIISIIKEGKELLNQCADNATVSSIINNEEINESCTKTTERSEKLLEDLQNCSKKTGLGVISCYRGIIQNDVLPVKKKLIEYCKDHQNSHTKSIEIRDVANDCVDLVISNSDAAINKVITKFIQC